MNVERESALVLLNELTPHVVSTASQREKSFLPSKSTEVPWNEYPNPWCAGWAFGVGPHFAQALDTRLTPKVWKETVKDQDGKPVHETDEHGLPVLTASGKPKLKKIQHKILEWTQGSLFDFREGYTMEGVDTGSPVCIQVQEAKAVEPASIRIERWEFRPEDLEAHIRQVEELGYQTSYRENAPGEKPCELRVMIPRNPGLARLSVYLPNDGPTIWRLHEKHYLTQDHLVKVLIAGLDSV